MMNYESMNNHTVCMPSFEFERRNGALNKYMIPFVALISMISVSVLIGACIVAFFSSFFELPFLHISGYIFIPVLTFVLSTGLLIKFFLNLMVSYRFENGRIIRGKVATSVDYEGLKSQIPEIAATIVMGSRMGWIIKLIRMNMTPGFAQSYFDTEVYDRKEFYNPRLIKETKHEMIFECDNCKKLRIPKIYAGMCPMEGRMRLSFGSRIIATSVAVFIISLIIAITDLMISKYMTVTEYAPDIENTWQELEDEIDEYDYNLDHTGANIAVFSKKVGDRTSEITYRFDKNGNIVDVDVQMYFELGTSDFEDEIRGVIATMDAGFDKNDLDDFIEAVARSIEGEMTYDKLKSDKYTLTIGLSGEYIDIH